MKKIIFISFLLFLSFVLVSTANAQNCIEEGKIGDALSNDVCCDGLGKKGFSSPSADGGICSSYGTQFICSKNCGNSVCDSDENKCNCPKDCNQNIMVNPDSHISVCYEFYWFDNASKNCDKKQFCGDYMWSGLKVFENKSDCLNALNNLTITPSGPGPTGCEKGTTWDYDTNECKNCPEGVGFYLEGPVWKCGGSISCLEEGEIGTAGKNSCCAGLKEEIMQTSAIDSVAHIICTKCEGNNCGANKFGNYSQIKILPETAFLRAQERVGELGFSVSLKTVGKEDGAKPVYGVSGEKEVRLFGFIKIKIKVSVDVDTETGEIIKVHKPWWSFLTW